MDSKHRSYVPKAPPKMGDRTSPHRRIPTFERIPTTDRFGSRKPIRSDLYSSRLQPPPTSLARPPTPSKLELRLIELESKLKQFTDTSRAEELAKTTSQLSSECAALEVRVDEASSRATMVTLLLEDGKTESAEAVDRLSNRLEEGEELNRSLLSRIESATRIIDGLEELLFRSDVAHRTFEVTLDEFEKDLSKLPRRLTADVSGTEFVITKTDLRKSATLYALSQTEREGDRVFIDEDPELFNCFLRRLRGRRGEPWQRDANYRLQLSEFFDRMNLENPLPCEIPVQEEQSGWGIFRRSELVGHTLMVGPKKMVDGMPVEPSKTFTITDSKTTVPMNNWFYQPVREIGPPGRIYYLYSDRMILTVLPGERLRGELSDSGEVIEYSFVDFISDYGGDGPELPRMYCPIHLFDDAGLLL